MDSPAFWTAMWEFGGIIASKPYEHVGVNLEDMLNSRWFVGAELNFAENLLRFRDGRTALILKGETSEAVRLSYAELYDQVARLRHVPAKIIAVKDIPYTLNGKKVELAVYNVIHQEPVLNKDALANPEALDLFKDLEDLKS